MIELLEKHGVEVTRTETDHEVGDKLFTVELRYGGQTVSVCTNDKEKSEKMAVNMFITKMLKNRCEYCDGREYNKFISSTTLI